MLHLDLNDQRALSPYTFLLLPRDISHLKKNGNNITVVQAFQSSPFYTVTHRLSMGNQSPVKATNKDPHVSAAAGRGDPDWKAGSNALRRTMEKSQSEFQKSKAIFIWVQR